MTTNEPITEPARFTFRDLHNIVAIADTGSVTVAAEHVGLSQPAMSAALNRLETALDTTLLIRQRGRGADLTPEGLAFSIEARAILRRAADLQSEITARSESGAGRLVVGCLTTVAPIVAPRLLRTFSDRFPRVKVELVTGSQDQMLDFVEHGRVHVALTYDLGLSGNLQFEPLQNALPLALLPGGHRLAGRTSITLKHLAAEPYLLLDLPISRDYFTSLFLTEGIPPRPAARLADIELVRSMVGNGFGYSLVNLLPAGTTTLDGSRVAYVPVISKLPALQLGLAVRPDERDDRPLAAFVEHARAFAETSRRQDIAAPNAATAER